MLANTNLSGEEVWRFEGTLQWWRNTYMGVIIPVTIFSIIVGVAIIVIQPMFEENEECESLKNL